MRLFAIPIILFVTIILLGNSVQSNNNPPDKAASLKAFETVLAVLKDPRCINCHPSDNRPRQGDDQHIHLNNVMRGEDNHGGPTQKCNTCHQSENNPYSLVPGAPHWGLAPKSMGWLGLSDIAIGQALVDTSKNGGKSPQDLYKHMTEDALVLWGWNPGGNRAPVKIPFEEFKAALQTWIDNGAHVPTEK